MQNSIVQSLKERHAELTQEARRIERALAALEPEAKAPKAAAPRPEGAPKRGRPKKDPAMADAQKNHPPARNGFGPGDEGKAAE